MDSKKRISRYPIIVRLSDEERERLEQIAAAWGVNITVAMRRLIREATVVKTA